MAHPPGDWDKPTSVKEFDLDESRKRGWCLDITFDAHDPELGKNEISFMLEGFSYPYFLKQSSDDIDVIRYVYGSSSLNFRASPFKSVVGVLSSPDEPIKLASKKLRVGSFLVLGDQHGAAIKIFSVPICSIVKSYINLGD